MFEASPRSLTLGLALVSALVAAPAMAETATSTFKVTITIQKACTVNAGAASDISLGTVAATETDLDGNNTITVNCSKTTPYYIGLAPSNAATDGAGEMAGTGVTPLHHGRSLRGSTITEVAVEPLCGRCPDPPAGRSTRRTTPHSGWSGVRQRRP